jgi:hypothetical protein
MVVFVVLTLAVSYINPAISRSVTYMKVGARTMKSQSSDQAIPVHNDRMRE